MSKHQKPAMEPVRLGMNEGAIQFFRGQFVINHSSKDGKSDYWVFVPLALIVREMNKPGVKWLRAMDRR